MINRREFVAAVAGSMALAGLTPIATAAADRDSGRLSDGLTRGRFEALLQQNFYVYESARGVTNLQLVAVRERRSKQQQRIEQFSLYFRGAEVERLASGVYRFEHPYSVRFDLRIDLIGRDAHGLIYRSDFSLLI